MDVCCTDVRVGSHPSPSSESSEPHRSFFSRHGKKLIAVAALAVSLAIVVSVAIAATLSYKTSSNATASENGNGDTSNNSSDNVAAFKTKSELDPTEDISSSNIAINSTTPFSGNISDFIVLARNQEVALRQPPTFGANDCSIGEGLWNLLLITDDYPWETKWELYSSSSSDNGERILASGPREGTNYAPQTRYTGNLCLPAGLYYMRWFDRMEDGLCCKYGQGEWTVTVNREVMIENVTMDNFAQKDFPFQVVASSIDGDGEMTGTFLILPRYHDVNVEFVDGTTYELRNLPPDFDYAESGLVSGVSSIALPLDTEIFPNGTADLKGEAPRVINRRLIGKHLKEINKETPSMLTRRKQEQGGNLRTSHLHRKLANFKGDQTVLAVRVIAADGRTTANETLLSNSIFGNGIDPVNLVSQFKACSYEKMSMIKTQSKSGWSKISGDVQIANGLVTIRLPSTSTTQGHALMRNAITKELNEIFGVENPSQLANYVLYCLPSGTGIPGAGIAYAYINSWLSVFNDNWCTSVSLQMHELGHSINFGHSNEGGMAYEDNTGIMGYSYPNSNLPLTCFNAAKSWQTGWYRDKGIAINSAGKTTCFSGIIHGVADYPIANTVLLKIQNGSGNDYYINFNAKKGINKGTQEGGNQVTVVSRPRGPRDSYAESELVAKLGREEYYSILGYTIFVGVVDADTGTAEVTVLPTGQEDCDS